MKIEQYLRIILTNKFIPLVKKNKCEVCNSKKYLCVHHVKSFAEILKETLQELNLKFKDSTEYNEYELNLITNVVLGKHLGYEYLTLCKECHKSIHKELGGTYKLGGKFDLYIESIKLKKETQNKKEITNVILYLKNKINKKLTKEENQELIKIMNIKDKRDKN